MPTLALPVYCLHEVLYLQLKYAWLDVLLSAKQFRS